MVFSFVYLYTNTLIHLTPQPLLKMRKATKTKRNKTETNKQILREDYYDQIKSIHGYVPFYADRLH